MSHMRLLPDGPWLQNDDRHPSILKALLVKLLALMTITHPPPWWALVLQAVGSFVLAWWAGLEPLQHTLGYLMTLDYFYGTALALRAGTWTWGSAAWGITRKGMIFSAAVLFGLLLRQNSLAPAASAITLFYIGTESISVFRKLTAADVPVAPPLIEVIRGLLKYQQDEKRKK